MKKIHGVFMNEQTDKYPRRTSGKILCSCGGQLITEQTTAGHCQDQHYIYRVHCKWCPFSTPWLSYEGSCIEIIANSIGIRKEPERNQCH